jgi:mannan endo-1,4-beta-mannosidase
MRARRWAAAIAATTVVAALAGCSLIRAPQPTAQSTGFASAVPEASQAAAASKAARPASALIHPSGKFFGIEAAGAPDSIGPVSAIAVSVGRNPNIIGNYVAWDSPFDAKAAANALNYGALYYMAWEPYGVTVRSIANGASDAYITNFAESVRDFGRPVALSFGHEMNGHWYPWGTTGTTPADFVAAWRHIHDLFTRAGANNVIWIWNPNDIYPVPDVQLKPYWPGSAYVDWVGITGYFGITGPASFAQLYGPTMTEIRQFTSKPFIIAETAVETGPDELARIQDLISGVKDHSDVLGFIWFNYVKAGVDWTLTGRSKARATFASLITELPLASLTK